MSKTAVIYIKDNNDKVAQKFFCLAYCLDNEYEVLSTTNNIDEVDNCDVMVVASPEMISRDRIEYYIVLDEYRTNIVNYMTKQMWEEKE